MNPLQVLEIDELQQMPEDQRRERFEIKDLDGVNWAFRKIMAYNSKRAELEALARAEIERIQSWLAQESKQINDGISFFEALLTEYAVIQREVDPKFKASTPYGKISFRKQQPQWEYQEETVIQSLKDAGLNDLIRVKEEPNKVEIKKSLTVVDGRAVDQDGQIIDGITIIERPDKVEIKVEG